MYSKLLACGIYCVQASPFIKPGRGVSVQFDSAEASYVPSTVYKEGRSKKKKTLIIKITPVRTWKDVSVFGKGRDVFAFFTSRKESVTKLPESGSVIERVRSGAV